MLKKLSTILPNAALRNLASGLFQSKLLFGLPVFGPFWYPTKYRDSNLNKVTMCQADVTFLQRLQNQVMRLLTGDNFGQKSTSELLKETNYLSVHQLCGLSTLRIVSNAAEKGAPYWIAKQLVPQLPTRSSDEGFKPIKSRLNLRTESLGPKAVDFWNLVPLDTRSLPPTLRRAAMKKWVKECVPDKPGHQPDKWNPAPHT